MAQPAFALLDVQSNQHKKNPFDAKYLAFTSKRKRFEVRSWPLVVTLDTAMHLLPLWQYCAVFLLIHTSASHLLHDLSLRKVKGDADELIQQATGRPSSHAAAKHNCRSSAHIPRAQHLPTPGKRTATAPVAGSGAAAAAVTEVTAAVSELHAHLEVGMFAGAGAGDVVKISPTYSDPLSCTGGGESAFLACMPYIASI